MAAAIAARRHYSVDEDTPVKGVLAQELSYFVTKGEEERRNLQQTKIADREERMDSWIPYRKFCREIYNEDTVQVTIAVLIMLNFVAEALKAQIVPDKMSDSAAQLAQGTFFERLFLYLEYVFTIVFALELFLEYVWKFFLAILDRAWVGLELV